MLVLVLRTKGLRTTSCLGNKGKGRQLAKQRRKKNKSVRFCFAESKRDVSVRLCYNPFLTSIFLVLPFKSLLIPDALFFSSSSVSGGLHCKDATFITGNDGSKIEHKEEKNSGERGEGGEELEREGGREGRKKKKNNKTGCIKIGFFFGGGVEGMK